MPGHMPVHQLVRMGELVLGIDVADFVLGFDDDCFPIRSTIMRSRRARQSVYVRCVMRLWLSR